MCLVFSIFLEMLNVSCILYLRVKNKIIFKQQVFCFNVIVYT